MNPAENLTYDVFVNDPPPQDGLLPNGEPKLFSPMATTLIYGSQDAVLTDPGMTADQARVLGDWVAARGRNLTDIFITHGPRRSLVRRRAAGRTVRGLRRRLGWHDHADARERRYAAVPVGQGVYGHPPSPVTAVTVPGNRFTLEGHDLAIVEVGPTDSADSTVLHVPDLGLVVAGDVIYNGVHMYLAQATVGGGFGPWRNAIDKVQALKPRHIVAGHQNNKLDDDADRTIAETRQYLDDADDLLRNENSAVAFFNAKIERYPDRLGRTVLWAGASVLYGAREHPGADLAQIILAAWL